MAKHKKLADFFEEKNLEKIVLKCDYLLKQYQLFEEYKKHPERYERPLKAPSEHYYDRILSRHFPPMTEVLDEWHLLSCDKKSHFSLISKYVANIYHDVFKHKGASFILNVFW